MGFPTVTLGVLLAFGLRYAGGVPVDAAQIVWGMLTWLVLGWAVGVRVVRHWAGRRAALDRKSTRLNSSHQIISYAVFCLKKKRPVLSDLPTTDTWSPVV